MGGAGISVVGMRRPCWGKMALCKVGMYLPSACDGPGAPYLSPPSLDLGLV